MILAWRKQKSVGFEKVLRGASTYTDSMIRKYSVPVGLLDGIFGVEGDPLPLSCSDIQITD